MRHSLTELPHVPGTDGSLTELTEVPGTGMEVLQTNALGKTPRANARSMQDGWRGLRRQRGRDGGWRANWFRRKTRGVFIIYSKAIFRKISQGLTCVLVLYCFTSIDIIADSRLGKNEKYVIMTLDPNHTQTLIGMYAFQLYG